MISIKCINCIQYYVYYHVVTLTFRLLLQYIYVYIMYKYIKNTNKKKYQS